MTGAGQALLRSAIDYAGTFPPARLAPADAMRAYARYRAGPRAWLLGRLILPAAKLDDFEALFLRTPGGAGSESWELSVILSSAEAGEIERVQAFARRWEGRARVASLEAPPLSPSRIREAAARLPAGMEAFFEVAPGPELEPSLQAIAGAGRGAKVRTGGLSVEAFPDARSLVRFLEACMRAHVPWKATAGLHHPLRGRHPVDGPESPLAPMHGFLNLAAAACLVHTGKGSPEEALQALEESSPEAFLFAERAFEWRGRTLGVEEIRAARRSFFRSFGACSFEEPVQGLEEAALL